MSKFRPDCVVVSRRSPLRLLPPPCRAKFILRIFRKLFMYSALSIHKQTRAVKHFFTARYNSNYTIPEKKMGKRWRKTFFTSPCSDRLKICCSMLAERADEIIRKSISLIHISANLAYKAFLSACIRFRFYIVLIVGVGYGIPV